MTTLAENLTRLMQERRLKDRDLGAIAGCSHVTIGKLRRGEIDNTKFLPAIAKALGVTVGEIDPNFMVGSGPLVKLSQVVAWDSSTPLENDEVELPLFREVELSAGLGSTEVIENHGAKLRFARSTLSRNGILPQHAACCYVNGDSMEPVLPNGSTVAIDTANKIIIDGKMYAINQGGMLRVKYLYRLPAGGIRIKSENRAEYPDEEVYPQSDDDFRILGKVFWYGVLLT